MIYGSLQAEFMETKHSGHIHRYIFKFFMRQFYIEIREQDFSN